MPDTKTLIESTEASSGTRPDEASVSQEHSGTGGPRRAPGAPMFIPWWARLIPFFLSAFFFLSAIFAIFAPLPLLLLHFRQGRKWAWLAVVTNSILVGFAAGGASLGVYAVFVASIALALPELLKRGKSIEKAALWTLGTMVLVGAVVVFSYARFQHVNVVTELNKQISQAVDYVGQSMQSTGNAPVNPADMDEMKQSVLVEFPSAVSVVALIMIWANLVLILRANPNGVREKMGLDAGFLKKWKAPEYLVWPTIAAGFFVILGAGTVSEIALNVFKFLMAIYAIQGLSILGFFFDLWNIRGFFRLVGFLVAIFLMMPLLLSLGFFDLWFDFRSKFRQS